jgi:hypothetical protein
MSILQLTYNYNTILQFFDLTYYLLIHHISMGQLQHSSILVVLKL